MYQTFIKPLIKDISHLILDTFFPINCLACGSEGKFICNSCAGLLKPVESQKCIVCQKNSPFGLTHPSCISPHTPDGLISVYDYHDPQVSKIAIKAKYDFLQDAYKLLAEMTSKNLRENYPWVLKENFILVPMPLHHRRKRWRGFNQSEVLCQCLKELLGYEVLNALVRTKDTKTQKDLKKEQRKKNMIGAFALKKESDVHGKNILLVDDVTTTGATLTEATQVLKRNGSQKVICLTIAKD